MCEFKFVHNLAFSYYLYGQSFELLGGDQGANPHSALVADPSGALYGTLFEGGLSTLGAIYQFVP